MEKISSTIAAITDFLFIGKEKNELHKSDLVIVLGNDYIDGTMEQVSDLFNRGIIVDTAKIILSGATGALSAGKDLECNRLFDSAVKKYNMPEELFIKEPNAKNACQNFQYCKEIIEGLGGFDKFNSILCIGKAFLLRRASMYAAKFEYPEQKMQYFGTVDIEGRNIGPGVWWKSEEATSRVMAEIERIGKYYASGDLSIY